MSKEQIKAKLEKLLRLSRRGTGGEAVNAGALLNKLLNQHGLRLSDIDDEARKINLEVSYQSKYERRLFWQIVSMVTNGDDERNQWFYRGSRILGVEVTPKEKAEILVYYDAYKRAFKDEMETMFIAFVSKQHIFPQKSASDDEPPRDLTENEKRAIGMMDNLKPVSVHQALESHS